MSMGSRVGASQGRAARAHLRHALHNTAELLGPDHRPDGPPVAWLAAAIAPRGEPGWLALDVGRVARRRPRGVGGIQVKPRLEIGDPPLQTTDDGGEKRLGFGCECVPDRLGHRFRAAHGPVIKGRVGPGNGAEGGFRGDRAMGYFVTTRWGGNEHEPTAERLWEVLGQLDAEDDEHPSVSLTHESGWCLAAYPGGLLIWENVEDDDAPRHRNEVPREYVLELWIKFTHGMLDEIEREPWLSGYED